MSQQTNGVIYGGQKSSVLDSTWFFKFLRRRRGQVMLRNVCAVEDLTSDLEEGELKSDNEVEFVGVEISNVRSVLQSAVCFTAKESPIEITKKKTVQEQQAYSTIRHACRTQNNWKEDAW